MSVRELFSFSDLPAVNSSPDSVRKSFQDRYGKKPDGICVNSETYYNAVQPAITEQYGMPCYKVLGEFEYEDDGESHPDEGILGSNYAVNQGDEEATISLTVDASWTEETSWSSEVTAGLTISAEVQIEGVFSTGVSFSESITVGKTQSQQSSRSVSSTVSVVVPPRSKKKVSIVGTLKKAKMKFEAPVSVQGMFGANFPDKVDGHYYWFMDANHALEQASGKIKGVIENAAIFDVQTEIGKTESL
ncbi:hydralysin-2 [Marinicrinis sediminis]|uniref:Hydralysin-2 n=1 Tax=Marinicrinis sediminis TaxID=1652465 RepID=A0ABW5R932_9BACL